MLRTIFIGVAIGLVTLWLWDRWQRAQAEAAEGGDTILARITRMMSAPSRRERTMPVNLGMGEVQRGGGCGCS